MGFIDPRTLPQAEPKPGWHGRFFHVWHIIDGEVDLTLGQETRCVRAGSAVVIPSGTTHAVEAKKRCRAIVVDYPVRREVGGVKI